MARAERIFHALIAWNEQHPDDTFAMTDWLLEGVFNVNRKAAKQSGVTQLGEGSSEERSGKCELHPEQYRV